MVEPELELDDRFTYIRVEREALMTKQRASV